jgi:rhodanese-related sulfurtransferase
MPRSGIKPFVALRGSFFDYFSDVRPRDVRAQDGIIPGAVSAHPKDIDPVIKSYSLDTEIIIYCACPNEASAATAAKHLKRAGFKKIRPLLGGIEAWVQAGHPVEHTEFTEKGGGLRWLCLAQR